MSCTLTRLQLFESDPYAEPIFVMQYLRWPPHRFSLQVFLHLASHLASWGWWRPQLFRGLFSAPSQAGEARYLKRPLADRQWSQRSGGPGRPASSPERLFVAQTLPGSAYPFTSQAPSPTGPQLQPTTRPQLLIIWLMERH